MLSVRPCCSRNNPILTLILARPFADGAAGLIWFASCSKPCNERRVVDDHLPSTPIRPGWVRMLPRSPRFPSNHTTTTSRASFVNIQSTNGWIASFQHLAPCLQRHVSNLSTASTTSSGLSPSQFHMAFSTGGLFGRRWRIAQQMSPHGSSMSATWKAGALIVL